MLEKVSLKNQEPPGMKPILSKLILALLALISLNAAAVTRYVDLNSPSPTPPYTSWPTAATNIQDAIDAAVAGDLVLVTNGVYNTGARLVAGVTTSNRVAVTQPVVLQSVNGPSLTFIEGYKPPGTTNGLSAVRCIYLINGAAMAGFTLTNGATGSSASGGGIWFQTVSHTTTVVSNCIITRNFADGGGAGAYGGGTLVNCTIISNSARLYGGGAYGNVLIACILRGNAAGTWGGGSMQCSLTNCLLVFNSAGSNGGGDYAGKLKNCTVTGNSTTGPGGGVANNGTLDSCIVYFNSGGTLPNGTGANYWDSGFRNCCTTPLTNLNNNITNDPRFVDFAGSDFHLQSNSPCINAGYNASVTVIADLDGNSRIVGNNVDIGVYEFQSPSSLLSYAWAQQNSLPTDGSADFTDPDSDGMNNYGEWRSDTVPTNALSVLKMVTATNSPTGAKVTWQSVSTRSYWLERATNLSIASPFQSIATNIAGVAGTKTFTDTSATNGGPYFYRVGVQ